jgi:hypothetical protein
MFTLSLRRESRIRCYADGADRGRSEGGAIDAKEGGKQQEQLWPGPVDVKAIRKRVKMSQTITLETRPACTPSPYLAAGETIGENCCAA